MANLPIIHRDDLTRILEELFKDADREALRDLRRCCTVLTADDVRLAVHAATRPRLVLGR